VITAILSTSTVCCYPTGIPSGKLGKGVADTIHRFAEIKGEMLLIFGTYEPMNLTTARLPMPELELSLGLWQGSFRGISKTWLRWFTLEGELIPEPSEEAITAVEEAAAATRRAIMAEQEATEAKRKMEILAEKLRQLGVNPDEFDDNL